MSQTDENQLGALEKEYDANYISVYFILLVGLGCLGAGAYFIVSPFFYDNAVNYYISEPLGFGFVIGGGFAIKYFWNNRGGSAKLYQGGLAMTIGGRKYVMRWNEIAAVKEFTQLNYVNGIRGADTYECTIETARGESFTFTRLILFAQELGAIINEETFALMYPATLKKMRTGEQINFGDLKVDSNGLTVNNHSLLWNNIGGFSIKDGLILIADKSDKTVVSAPFATTPNAHVLVALLREFIN